MLNAADLLQALNQQVQKKTGPLDKVSGIHKYWARKPWHVIEYLMQKNSSPGDVVLDPFMGSGSIGAQAKLLGREFLGIDLNPIAVKIAGETLEMDFDVHNFDQAFEKIQLEVKKSIMQLYRVEDNYALWTTRNASAYLCLVADYNFKNKSRVTFSSDPLEEVSPALTLEFDREFPKNFYKDRFSYKGISKVSEMFSKRNIYALETIKKEIDRLDGSVREQLTLAFTNTVLHVSSLKSENMRPLGVNNYWIPDDHIEENVWWRFEDRVKKFRVAKMGIKNALEISKSEILEHKLINGDATNLALIETGSVDYVFTDPPYGDAVQYSELSMIWNAWLGQDYKIDNEVILNPKQNKNKKDYLDLLAASFSEIRRVLKQTGKLTLAFHNKDLSLWVGVAEILRALGFEFVDFLTESPKGAPFTLNWAKFSPKTDFYLTFTKGGPTGFHSEVDFAQAISEVREDAKSLESPALAYDLIVARVFSLVCDGVRIINTPKRVDIKSVLDDWE